MFYDSTTGDMPPKDFFQSQSFFLRYRKIAMLGALVSIALGIALYSMSAPRDFPAPTIITIPHGASLVSISEQFATAHMIRSATLFQMFAILFSGDRSIPSGDFAFESKMSVYRIAWRVAHGQFGIARKRVTIPEGSTVRDIAAIVSKQLINFDSAAFQSQAEPKEGYLFPDTYFFFSNTTADEVMTTLADNFNTKVAAIKSQFDNSKRRAADIITMASILEAEANKPADRRIVAGILWKRIDAGMRLQVDAPFFYLRQGSGGGKVTAKDLSVDSPYNTYMHKGLPPGPIGNPGLDSIEAALAPESSPYWYYLYDAEGMIHYAKTFEEHKANKAKYL